MTEFKPKLRKEASVDFHHGLIEASYKAIEAAKNFPFQNCLSCTRFNEPEERCKFFNAKPPARVIAFGCHEYDDVDKIPF